MLDSGAYDQVLIEITTYVSHYKIDNFLAKERARVALLDALGCAIETLHTTLNVPTSSDQSFRVPSFLMASGSLAPDMNLIP